MGGLTALVDTSVAIGAMDLIDPEKEGRWAVAAVTVGELYAGVLLTNEDAEQATRLRRLASVLSIATVLDVDRMVTARYGELRMESGRAPCNDLWIAATALAHDLELLTMDERMATLPFIRSTLIRSAD
ncbi:MAG TPA: type II toxin-antitoxin system VapC family toxin [Solirubrobacteraceae bacterium]|jgi:predicted nucleic acid-binding protein|nr:type II toxin-antitoxin system VapC family toxin [Solirubrobacteraceae bacterium]